MIHVRPPHVVPAGSHAVDTLPAAIGLRWARACRIDRCTATAVGGTGIGVGAGCRDCRVIDTTVSGAGGNRVMVGDGGDEADTAAAGNAVRNCVIERCGRRLFGAVGVWVGLTERTTIANCEIRDLPYTGVSVGRSWDDRPTPCRGNAIERNHIHHVMQLLSDGGAIYTLGLQPGTVFRGNAIHDVRRNAGRAPSNGFFFDQGTRGLLVEGNVIWAIDTTPLRWHMTHDNTVSGNTFVLGAGQSIAHDNRAAAEAIDYRDNRTPAAATWSTAAVASVLAAAGVRRE
ncbi:MAG: right-handed parallel beta-helix repeat-containing protein [Planctomycetes bacterium]|nr:right-handed parallel beta-helix repeat-containing protein [Planctomycetota bacterium]